MVQEREFAVHAPNPMMELSKQLADVKVSLKADPNPDIWALRHQLRVRSWVIQSDALKDKLQTETRTRKQSRLIKELTFLENRIDLEKRVAVSAARRSGGI